MNRAAGKITLEPADALLVVDLQNDFMPGGALGVKAGDQIIPLLNRCIALFQRRQLPVYATRDWHPPDHCSFTSRGGPWPVHCVAGTAGAAFAPSLRLPATASTISKATQRDHEAYSAFQGTDLADRLQGAGIERVFIGGLATDYCVLDSVRDALKLGFDACVLVECIRAVDARPGDGERAEAEMFRLGARAVRLADIGA